jgi:hypothetical protein
MARHCRRVRVSATADTIWSCQVSSMEPGFALTETNSRIDVVTAVTRG